MTNKKTVSPIGISAEDAANERVAHSAEYRAERERLALWADVAAQVILYRTRQGLSQAELGRRIGTSHTAISRLESGQHATGVETLRRIGEALGQPLRVAFGPIVDADADDDAAPARQRKHDRQLVTA